MNARFTTKIARVCIAVVTVMAVFCTSIWLSAVLWYRSMAAHAPADPSIGDSVVWGMIFIIPVLLPIYGLLSLAVGVPIAHFINKRIFRSPR